MSLDHVTLLSVPGPAIGYSYARSEIVAVADKSGNYYTSDDWARISWPVITLIIVLSLTS